MEQIEKDLISRYQKEAEKVVQTQEHRPILTLVSSPQDGREEPSISVIQIVCSPGQVKSSLERILEERKPEAYILVAEAQIRGVFQDRGSLLVMAYCRNRGESKQYLSQIRGEIPNRRIEEWVDSEVQGTIIIREW